MSNYNHVFTISKYTLTFFLALGQDLCKPQESSSSISCLKKNITLKFSYFCMGISKSTCDMPLLEIVIQLFPTDGFSS